VLPIEDFLDKYESATSARIAPQHSSVS